MRPVVLPFFRFRTLFVSNVYLLDGGPGDRWLVDCGHWSERLQLAAELRRTGLAPGDLTGLLLTHRHSDHAGNAGWLSREFGVKVYAHRADAAVLESTAPRAEMGHRGSLLERALCAVENRWPARVPIARGLEGGDTVAGLEVHHVPGHTEGSVLYRHPGTGCLLSGDTLLTARPPLVLRADLVRAYDAFSLDLAQAHASLDAFHRAGFAYQHLLAGHGRPLSGQARARVLEVLAQRDAASK
jgi:glyoxylase-like metal-dependent hydrolase (beta-lactamase superfamily II)